jgi:hypothetical protein
MEYVPPKNDMPFFYKYASAKTALRVIPTQTFRWSSPLKFNDPFDHQTGLAFPFNGEQLALAINAAAETVLFGEEAFNPPHSARYGEALRRLRAIRDRLPRDEVLASMREAGEEIARAFPAHCDTLNREITERLTHSRVLCLTEALDNVVMWSHYADEHRGVVFKLRRLEERDHRFLAARRVTYSAAPVAFLSLDEYIESQLGIANHDLLPRVWDIAYRKHLDWAYEKEWRVHVPLLQELPGDGFSYYEEPKELIEAIYLGCRMDAATVEDMKHLIRESLPDTAIFQARKSRERIALEFQPIA